MQVYLAVSVTRPTANAACQQAADTTTKVRSLCSRCPCTDWFITRLFPKHRPGRPTHMPQLGPSATTHGSETATAPPPLPLPPPHTHHRHHHHNTNPTTTRAHAPAFIPARTQPPPAQVRDALDAINGISPEDVTTENYSVQPNYVYNPDTQ